VAVNPLTGVSLGAGSSVAIGTIVPNSGVLLNGIIQAGHGIAKENYIEDPFVFGPRIGAAYDLTGAQKIVVRGQHRGLLRPDAGRFGLRADRQPAHRHQCHAGELDAAVGGSCRHDGRAGRADAAHLQLRLEDRRIDELERRRTDGAALVVVA
jgi:hypothetical protein